MRKSPAAVPAVLAVIAFLLPGPAPCAAAESAGSRILVPEGWEGAYDFGYAPAVRVGDQLIVSGIPAGGPGSYEEQIRRMYERAGEVLAAGGATFADVVELTTFHVAAKDSAAFREEFGKYMPIHQEFFGDHRPAWTAIGNAVLLAPEAPVEMRLVAVVGSGEDSRVVRGSLATVPDEEAPGAEATGEEDGTEPREPAPPPQPPEPGMETSGLQGEGR